MMYSKILIPLDGSKLAEVVLPYARLFARALQLPVDLLHVKDPETAVTLSQSMQAAAPEQIIDLAQKTSDNIVVMSSHGRSGMNRWILGSVANRVAGYCGDPRVAAAPADIRQGLDLFHSRFVCLKRVSTGL